MRETKPPRRRPGKPDGRRATNRKRRVESLQRAALTVFLQHGVEATTIEQITRAAGTAKGSFYRYFDDKTALVASLVAPISALVLAAIDDCEETLARASTREEMFAAYGIIAARFAPVLLSSADAVRLLLQEARAPGVGARAPIRAFHVAVDGRALDLGRLAQSHGLVTADVDPRVSARAVVGAVERLVFAVLSGEDIGDPFAVPEALTRIMLDGLRPRS